MAIRAGRVGVRPDQVDVHGRVLDIIGGVHPHVSAGSLVSSASVESSKVNTPSSFTGKIDLTSIKGNTVKWNQLARYVYAFNSVVAYGFGVRANATLTLSGRTAHCVFPLVGSRLVCCGYSEQNHIYYAKAKVKSSISETVTLEFSRGWIKSMNAVEADVETDIEAFVRLTNVEQSENILAQFFIANASNYTLEVKDMEIFDLTNMFGAGNEPTTVEQFKSMFPLNYYEYDTGSLLSFNASALQNALTGEEIHLPTLTYFPTGMKSAGTVYDDLTSEKAITRIGSVTLDGTQDVAIANWRTTSNSVGMVFPYDLTDNKTYGESVVGNVVSTVQVGSHNDGYNGTYDQMVAFYTNSNYGLIVRLSDTTLTTNELIKQYFANHPLTIYYELATPVETDIDVDFNLSLNVNEGENVQLLPLGTDTPATAPLRATVTSYKSGATGNDVEKLLGSIAQVETSPATTNHAEGDYIMYNYQLYKVTASITTGASLVVGTNITATTVMDEFKTL